MAAVQPPEHPSLELIHAFGSGRLTAAEMAIIEPHLAQCPDCAERLASIGADSLLNLARQAVEMPSRFEIGSTLPGGDQTSAYVGERIASKPSGDIPEELRDHPRYRILKMLGVGGMGMVFLAEHKMMERRVALKVIAPHLTARSDAVERFRLEVRAAARLQHANIVTAHDAEQAGNLHFLVMEYVEGIDLARYVQRRGTLTPPQALALIRQVAMGLQHAHENGMVHRDIKPQNLMVTCKGVVKILDFGLARFASEQREIVAETDGGSSPIDRASITGASIVLGTPDYLAPEQARTSKVDIRADIYSLGCTLYFFLSGRAPFTGETALAKMFKHIEEDPVPIESIRSDITPDVAALLKRMMAKRPQDRFATPQELVQAITTIQKNRLRPDGKPGTGTDDHADVLLLEAVDAPTDVLDTVDRTEEATSASGITRGKSSRTKAIKRRKVEARRRTQMIIAGVGMLAIVVAGVWAGRSLLKPTPIPDPGTQAALLPTIEPSPLPQPIKDIKSLVPPKGPLAGLIESRPFGKFKGPQPNRPAIAKTNKVLFVIPMDGVWYPDYEPVRREVEAGGFEVVVASQHLGRAKPAKGSGGEPIVVDRSLLEPIRSKEFDAVYFCGYYVDPLLKDPKIRGTMNQLIDEMAADWKPVTAMCFGTRILLELNKLDGKRVAGTNEMAARYDKRDITWLTQPLAIDGVFLTSDQDRNAEFFGRALVKLLKNPKDR